MNVLTTDDIFEGAIITDIHTESGRTLIGDILQRVYSRVFSKEPAEDMNRYDWVDVLGDLWDTMAIEIPKPFAAASRRGRGIKSTPR